METSGSKESRRDILASFDSCLSITQKKGRPSSANDGLELYALLQQATEGDVLKDQPSRINIIERAKWDAWNSKRGLTKEEAMEQFVLTVRKAYSCSC